MARTRKTAVRGIVEPRLRPSTVAVAALSAIFGAMILYNIFLGQDGYSDEQRLAGTTQMTVSAPGKGSRSITLKYEELVEDVQRELLATGHFQGLVDGVNGPRTKTAVEAYQRDTGTAVTGEVSKKLLEHIRYTRKLAQAAEFTGSVTPIAKKKPEPAPPEVTVKSVTSIAELALQELASAPANLPSKDKEIISLQMRLAKLGYDPGSRSGVLDDATKAAILIFEMDHGLEMQGEISAQLLAALQQAESRNASQ